MLFDYPNNSLIRTTPGLISSDNRSSTVLYMDFPNKNRTYIKWRV